MNVPLPLAISATGATLLDGHGAPAEIRASTDTRAIRRGDTFVALHGLNFDGHDFTAEAVRRGAGDAHFAGHQVYRDPAHQIHETAFVPERT